MPLSGLINAVFLMIERKEIKRYPCIKLKKIEAVFAYKHDDISHT